MVFGSLANTLIAQENKGFKFSIGCEVTDQVVLGTKDGVPKRYIAYENDLKIGDLFRVEFDYKEYAWGPVLQINVPRLGMIQSFDSITGREFGDGTYDFRSESKRDVGSIGPDDLKLFSVFELSITMQRYYKNDWELMTSDGSGIAVARLLTANCKSMPTQFDDVYQAFHKKLNKK